MGNIFLGDTYILQATLTDTNDAPVTPDSQSAKLYDPNLSLKDHDDAPVLQSAGTYWATLNIPTNGKSGIWTIIWTINITGITDSEKHHFKVKSNP